MVFLSKCQKYFYVTNLFPPKISEFDKSEAKSKQFPLDKTISYFTKSAKIVSLFLYLVIFSNYVRSLFLGFKTYTL